MSETYSVQTNLQSGLKMTFLYTVEVSDRVATVKWSLSPKPYTDPNGDPRNAHYHLCEGEQHLYIYVYGERVYSKTIGASYRSDGKTVYNGYCDAGSSLDKAYGGKEYHDYNGDWTGVERWVKVLGADWLSGSFKVPYKDSGKASFALSGKFDCFSASGQSPMVFSSKDVISLPPISKKTYRVEYNANGGKDAPSTQKKMYGESLTLSKSKPTRSGYTFKSWNTKKDGSGKSYKSGGTYSEDSDVTLYAQWTANVYSIIFKDYFSSKTIADSNVTYGKVPNSKDFSSIKFAGYNVLGWSKSKQQIYVEAPSSLSKVEFDLTEKYTVSGDTTLYPILQYSSAIYVKYNGTWKVAIPYVKYNGVWKQAIPYAKYNGTWKI